MPAAWKPVSVTRQWSFEGGYISKPIILETKQVDTASGAVDFVKIEKNQEWLLKAVLGTGFNKGGLRRSTLLSSMKNKLEEKASGPQSRANPEDDTKMVSQAPLEDSPNTPVGEHASSDPMNQLDDIGTACATPAKKRKVYTSKRGKNNITQIDMPEFEPTSHPNRVERRTITLLALSTNSLYLRVDDLDWLLTWLRDEIRSGGVPVVLGDPLEALGCNCEADRVHIRWDFGGAWEAIILAGEKKGTTVKSYVAKFNAEKWLAIGGHATYGVDFESATENHLKAATFEYLEKHMKEVVSPQLRT